MPKNTQLTNATANGQADYLSDQLDNGYLRIYDGSQPATADTAIGSQVLLAELRFNATAAPAAVDGVLTFNALTADSSANATGTATWARCLKSDGSSVVMDVSVATSDANVVLNTASISSGGSVSVTSFSYTVAKSTSGS